MESHKQPLNDSQPKLGSPNPVDTPKKETTEAQSNLSMDDRYLNFFDECSKMCPPILPFQHPDEEIKQYLLSRIKNFTLTADLEEKDSVKISRYMFKIATLINEYRTKPPPDSQKYFKRSIKEFTFKFA